MGATKKDLLLAKVVAHASAHGLGDTSLRDLAAAIGTSHRMLIYHFGSREGLVVAVVQAVEAAQRAFLTELAASDAPPAEVMRAMWRRLADPSLWPSERLFFEIYSQALHGRPGTTGLLDDIVDAWIEPMVALARQHGLDADAARVDARLGVAVARGLLLDLLATRHRAAVDAAVERYLAGYLAIVRQGSVRSCKNESVQPMPLELQVNGSRRAVQVTADRTLLSVLRDDLELTGTKYGCGEGQCGACTVLVDGQPVLSCISPVMTAIGRSIQTIEGVADGDRLHPLQQAFVDRAAMQCGYCTPGMVMNGLALLRRSSSPSEAEIGQHMQTNICRCGCYPRIVQAIQDAAAKT